VHSAPAATSRASSHFTFRYKITRTLFNKPAAADTKEVIGVGNAEAEDEIAELYRRRV
jgi:hypothetical protein